MKRDDERHRLDCRKEQRMLAAVNQFDDPYSDEQEECGQRREPEVVADPIPVSWVHEEGEDRDEDAQKRLSEKYHPTAP